MIEPSEPGVLLTGRFDSKAKDLPKQLDAFRVELERLQAKAGANALLQAVQTEGSSLVVRILAAQVDAAPKKPAEKKAKAAPAPAPKKKKSW